MARRFRLYNKKRGGRATGSQRIGRWGEALFYCAFLLLGGVALTLIILTMLMPQWRASYVYAESTAKVIKVLSPYKNQTEKSTTYCPQILIEYEVEGVPYTAIAYDRLRSGYADEQRAIDLGNRFEAGKTYRCWYDPDDPHQVVLLRGAVWWVWLLAALPAAFVVFGIVGLGRTFLQSRTSRERRAVLAGRANRMELFESQQHELPKLPTVPRDADLKNSPGTTLAYRLPIATKPSWQLFAAAMTCLCWNALVAVFVTMAIRGYLAGNTDWLLIGFCVPFLAAGVWLCYFLARQFLITTGIGATRIEISDHPLLPGQEYELLLSQAGKLDIQSLEILLVCDEEATFCQGTDTVVDTKRVCEQMILHSEKLQIQPGLPYESRSMFRVPIGAMHSFKASYNCVNWKLVVRGKVDRWPDYERSFPVIVHPKVQETGRKPVPESNSNGQSATARVLGSDLA
ncbi:MAG: DUF3592 domain-containing protein [Planctomycetes bacterium]|nr:DUF3592 domain-containing protein [Planctomycetota bacterium]